MRSLAFSSRNIREKRPPSALLPPPFPRRAQHAQPHAPTLPLPPQPPPKSISADAPVTKAIVLATAAASLLANAGRGATASGGGGLSSPSSSSLPAPLAALAFASTSETLTGLALLYGGRLNERQAGTAQYGAGAAVVAGTAALLQLVAAAVARAVASRPASAAAASAAGSLPLAFAFAGLVPYAVDVPPQARFSLLGIPCTDKAFGYLAAAHAVWAAGPARGLIAAACGLAAGLVYRLNLFGVQRLRLPRWLGGGGSGGSGSCRVLVPPVIDPAAAAAGGDELLWGGGGGGFGAGGGAAGAGAGPRREQLQPQMVRRRR